MPSGLPALLVGGALDAACSAPAGALSEIESKALLERIGIPVTRDVVMRSADDVRFDALSPPVAVKILSPDIPHKTEVSGVKLNVRTPDELRAAIDEVLANARRLAPQARIEGVLVSGMVTGGFELLAGVVNDAAFGPVVVVGAGGIDTEVLQDTACRIAPFGDETAREMIDELRCRRVLDGTRGRPPLDVAAAARTLALLAHFAWQNRATIAEIDINPLVVLPQGVLAVDALIVLKRAATQTSAGQDAADDAKSG
jgi:acetyltransferase